MKHQTIDDGEPIPAFLGLRRNLALVGGEGDQPEPLEGCTNKDVRVVRGWCLSELAAVH